MRKLGIPRETIDELFNIVRIVSGLSRDDSSIPNVAKSTMSWFNTIGILTMLPRAGFNALGEPLNVGINTGSAKDSLLAMGGMIKAFSEKKGGTVNLRALWFESLGILGSGMDKIMMLNQFSDVFDSESRQAFASRGFTINFIAKLDRMSRISAATRGHAFLIASLRTDTAKNKIDLRRYGIDENMKQELKDWLLDEKGNPIPSESLGGNSEHGASDAVVKSYAVAISRFLQQTIQDPKKIDMPISSNNPVGRLIFSLSRFSYAYQKNIIGLVGKRVLGAMRGEIDTKRVLGAMRGEIDTVKLTPKERTQMAMMSILPVLTTYAGIAAINMVREGIADEDRLEELLESGEFWNLAMSRAGFYGAPDVIVQMWTGLKYRRDLQAISNDEDTDSSNKKILEGLYKLTVAPAIITATALTKASKLLDPAYGLANALIVTSPSVRRAEAARALEILK